MDTREIEQNKKLDAMRSAIRHQLVNNYDVNETDVDLIIQDFIGIVKSAVNFASYPYTPADRIAEAVGLTYNGNLDKQREIEG